MKLILLDNKDDQLNVIGSALEERWEKFAEMNAEQNIPIPQIKKIKYDKNSSEEEDLDIFVDSVINDNELNQETDSIFLLVDLFLTNKEENDKGPQKRYEEYSGYKMANKFCNKLYERKFNVALMTKFFKDVESTNQAKLGRVILKPIFPEMRRPVLRVGHTLPTPIYCSMNYGLPKKLDTRDVVQAFCNIVFYKYSSLIQE